MNETELRAQVLEALSGVAPEASVEDVDPTEDLREQFELDSFDLLNFIVALDQAVGVEISERDYAELVTLDSCVAYLSRRLEEPPETRRPSATGGA